MNAMASFRYHILRNIHFAGKNAAAPNFCRTGTIITGEFERHPIFWGELQGLARAFKIIVNKKII